MKLSIITVNLNNREGLQRTIDSVVCQTFRDFEWIVIDGGSTDGSRELIEQYADHFAYWVSEPDKGIYNAMNKGIKVAKGEYLQFLNSGDWLYNNNTLSLAFKNDFTENILFGRCIAHDPDAGEYEYGFCDNNFSAFQLLLQSLPHQGSFISRGLFTTCGQYNESMEICADLYFFYNAIINHNASVRWLPNIIANFDGTGISNQNLNLVEEERKFVANTFLPKRLTTDFFNYQTAIQNNRLIDVYLRQIEQNKTAIRLYTTLMRYAPTRLLTNLLVKFLKLKKGIDIISHHTSR